MEEEEVGAGADEKGTPPSSMIAVIGWGTDIA